MAEALDGSASERTIGGFLVPAEWPDEHDAAFLRMRSRQLAQSPANEPFLARAIVLRGNPRRPMIGHIGFHGPPKDGWLEMGYMVFEEYRRQGIAEEAARALMAWATGQHGIQRFRISISPENAPSLGMAAKIGFHQIGEQWDDEDGLEWVFELAVG